MIGPWGPKLFDEGMVVSKRLDAVKTGFLAAYGAVDKALDELFNLAHRHGVTAIGVVVSRLDVLAWAPPQSLRHRLEPVLYNKPSVGHRVGRICSCW